MSDENETSIDPPEAENSGSDAAAAEDKLEKLYGRLPKLIAHIYQDNAERHNALDRLLDTFGKINGIEASLNEGGSHDPLSLSRLYDLAVSGGGDTDIAELKAANDAFAEENKILAETIESLGFQIKSMRDKAADELVGNGEINGVVTQEILQSVDNVRGIIDDIHNRLGFLSGDSVEDSEKPLQMRLIEKFSDFDDITADMLKAAPRRTTMLGRFLRRVGFAYDHKDMAAARQLVATVLKANKDMGEIIETLRPAQQQLDKLHEVLTLLEVIAGHEERQTPQYQEAMEQIDRLQSRLDRMEALNGSLEEMENRNRDQEQKFAEESRERQVEIDQLGEDILDLKNELQLLAQEHPEKLKERIAQQQDTIDGLGEEIADLRQTHSEREDDLKNQIAQLRIRLRESENGMLVERLDMEIATLREMAEQYEQDAEKQREKREAFEQRVGQWIKDSEKQQKEIEKWQGIALKKYSKLGLKAACVGIAGVAGGIGIATMAQHMPGWAYWAFGILTPAASATLLHKLDHNDWAESFLGGLKYGLVGLAASAALSPVALNYEFEKSDLISEVREYQANVEEAYRAQILEACGESPCRIIQQEDGSTRVIRLSEEYAGQSVILTFPENEEIGSAPSEVILDQPLQITPPTGPEANEPT